MNESRRKVELPMDFYAHDLFWLMREAINERAAGVYRMSVLSCFLAGLCLASARAAS